MIREVTSTEEMHEAVQASGEAVVILTQPSWCVPCQRLKPHYEKLSEKGYSVVVVDLDAVPEGAVEFGVQSVPHVYYYRDGEYMEELRGRTVVQLEREIGNL